MVPTTLRVICLTRLMDGLPHGSSVPDNPSSEAKWPAKAKDFFNYLFIIDYRFKTILKFSPEN